MYGTDVAVNVSNLLNCGGVWVVQNNLICSFIIRGFDLWFCD